MFDLIVDNIPVKELDYTTLSPRQKNQIIKEFAEMNGLLSWDGIEVRKRHWKVRKARRG